MLVNNAVLQEMDISRDIVIAMLQYMLAEDTPVAADGFRPAYQA